MSGLALLLSEISNVSPLLFSTLPFSPKVLGFGLASSLDKKKKDNYFKPQM